MANASAKVDLNPKHTDKPTWMSFWPSIRSLRERTYIEAYQNQEIGTLVQEPNPKQYMEVLISPRKKIQTFSITSTNSSHIPIFKQLTNRNWITVPTSACGREKTKSKDFPFLCSTHNKRCQVLKKRKERKKEKRF